MDKNQEKKFKKMVAKSCKEMDRTMVIQWSKLSLYLENELTEGKREFRIAFQDEKKFIVHPLGKDGETLDMELNP